MKDKAGEAENVSKDTKDEEHSAPATTESPKKATSAEADVTTNKDDTEEVAKEETSAEEKPETKEAPLDEDKPDAVLEPVVEETQSQVAASATTAEEKIAVKESDDVVLVQSESETNDSPMDSDDVELVENTDKDVLSQQSAADKSAEGPSKNAEETVVIASKDTTPEPMEVDSSSNSNDVIEKMDDDVTIVETQSDEVIDKPQPASTQSDNAETAASTNADEVIKTNSIEPAVNDVIVPPSSTVVVPANNSLEAKTSSGEATNVAIANNDNNVENNTTPAANDTNKSENDLCK